MFIQQMDGEIRLSVVPLEALSHFVFRENNQSYEFGLAPSTSVRVVPYLKTITCHSYLKKANGGFNR
jgi:hypothetical protein